MKRILLLVLFLCISFGCSTSEDPPLSIKVALQDKDLTIDGNNQVKVTADVQVFNGSNVQQFVGVAGSCCIQELDNLVSDNPDIDIISGNVSCLADACPEEKINLSPKETWYQKCTIGYKGEKGRSGPVTFRIGIMDIYDAGGQKIVWGDPVTVNVIDKRPHDQGT